MAALALPLPVLPPTGSTTSPSSVNFRNGGRADTRNKEQAQSAA